MPNDTSPLIAQISASLDAVRDCLVRGNLAGLATLAVKLDELCQALTRERPGIAPDDLKALKSQAERQLALLGAALEGVRSAERRVAQLHNVCGELSTYDRDGQGRTLRFSAQNLEQRA
jgi:hypothetical protein